MTDCLSPHAPTPETNPLEWTAAGQPRSRIYGDVYFSAEDGLAEARTVFLQGCGLPEAWQGRRRFVVGELGFGTGLNIAALVDLWSKTRPANGRLHIFSVEAHPLSADDAARALSHWPELRPIVDRLIAGWPGRAAGPHRLELQDLGVILDVAIGDVAEALGAWRGRADAWFLDGFAPALNPGMWRDEVLALVAARSAPGAGAATFTVAGQVRRGLAAAGFAVERRPGHGRKRERLVARLPGVPGPDPWPPRVAIVGAGVAGAAAARAVRALGGEAMVFDAEGLCAGASGNPAALVTPRLDAGLSGPARLFAQAFRRAVALDEVCPDAILSRGALQLETAPVDAARFAKVAASDLFEPGTTPRLAAEQVAQALGEPAPEALAWSAGLVISPHRALAAWAPTVVPSKVARLEPGENGVWRLLDTQGVLVADADAVILTAGLATGELAENLPLVAVRGQASWTSPVEGHLPPAAAFGGYVLPLPGGGVLFGATHDRGQVDRDVRAEDHARNLESLAEGLPRLAERLAGQVLEGRASIRVATADQLPLAGRPPGARPGVFVLCAFGARGFTLAPLLAEHVAAIAMDAPSPLPGPLADIVDPARFRAREARRRS